MQFRPSAINSGYKIHELLRTSAWILSIQSKNRFSQVKEPDGTVWGTFWVKYKIESHHLYLGFISSEPALQCHQLKSDLINSSVDLLARTRAHTTGREWRSKSLGLPNLGTTTQNKTEHSESTLQCYLRILQQEECIEEWRENLGNFQILKTPR